MSVTMEQADVRAILKERSGNSYYNSQITTLADKLTLHRTVVDTILKDYRNMIRYQIRGGNQVTFLGAVNFRKKGTDFQWGETLATQATHISKARKISFTIVYGVLEAYYNLITELLAREQNVVVNGLFTLTVSRQRVYLTTSDSLESIARGFILDSLKYDVQRITSGRMCSKEKGTRNTEAKVGN